MSCNCPSKSNWMGLVGTFTVAEVAKIGNWCLGIGFVLGITVSTIISCLFK